MAGKRPQLNFDVDESLKRAFIGKVKNSGLDVKEVLTAYVQSYVTETTDNKAANSIKAGSVIPPKMGAAKDSIENSLPDSSRSKLYREVFSDHDNAILLDELANILDSGVTRAINAVTENLHVFAEFAAQNKGKKTPRNKRKPRRGAA
jgi:hypothetical protein